MDFDEWFDANGYAEEHRAIFRTVWEAAQNDGEGPPVYLTPEENRMAQHALNIAHREMADALFARFNASTQQP